MIAVLLAHSSLLLQFFSLGVETRGGVPSITCIMGFLVIDSAQQ